MHDYTNFPGPGLRTDPKRKIVERWLQGNFAFARLECGHTVRAPKSVDWREGVGVRCSACR